MCPWVLRAAVLLFVLTHFGVARAQELPAPAPAKSVEPESTESDSQGVVETWLKELGSYERSALNFALKKRKLELDMQPRGKALESIHVVNLDVLGKEVGFLRHLNLLHITTREHIIRREVLLRPGEEWNPVVVQETRRNLKDPLFTSIVLLMPVKAKSEGKVSLLVVTRDIWSLRMNSSFEVLQGKLTSLQLSVAENNIFGLRKHGAFVFSMGQGSFSLGPQYIDKRLAGTRLRLSSRFGALFARETRKFEGTNSSTTLSYPLWSLRRKWGASVRVTHLDSIVRAFRGTDIELIDDPDTPELEEVERIYQLRTLGLESSAVRAYGKSIKQQYTIGHSLSSVRPDFLDTFNGTDAERELLERVAFPRSEVASALFVRYRLFDPDFVVYRNLNGYDLAEDIRLGPDLSLGASASLQAIGSTNNFYRGSAGASWTLGLLGDGFVRVAGSASTRLQAGELIDNVLGSSAKVATPHLAGFARLVAQANLSVRLRERANGRFRVGGNSGLRGYEIAEFSGQKRLITNVEFRSIPLRLLFARVGAVAFWDMAHAADRLGELKMKHGVGLGLRYLVPQLQPIVFRFDWAVPLNGDAAGFPGRFSAGVAQTF